MLIVLVTVLDGTFNKTYERVKVHEAKRTKKS